LDDDPVIFPPHLEHFKKPQPFDTLFLGLDKLSSDAFCLQLNPNRLPKESQKLEYYLDRRKNWGIRFFELNDKYVTKDFIQKIRPIIPSHKVLFSSESSDLFLDIPNKKHWSWDLNLGEPPQGVSILSLHHRGQKELQTILEDFSSFKKYHLKLAVEIFNLKELEQGYQWQQQDSLNRSFLPRSVDGRWRWFRNVFGSKNLLHFIRESSSSILDQPLFSEAIHFSKPHKKLGAVLGDPIEFSATPNEHNSFFYQDRSIPILPIPLKENELTTENLDLFSRLGFVFFAVTSPLKRQAFLNSHPANHSVRNIGQANTLIFHHNQWYSYNTDVEGFKSLKKYTQGRSVVVWGGGGVRLALKSLFSSAVFYSARTAQVVFGKKRKRYDVLIWAVGRKRMKNCVFPPKDWTVKEVIDLNYVADSPGREYALKCKAKYRGGEFIFKQQAQKQREIFLKYNECK